MNSFVKLVFLLLGRFMFLLACWTAVLLAFVFVKAMTKLVQCLPSVSKSFIAPSRKGPWLG